ncbi:hypothetical protein DFH07DRAFT_707196, partial [Mycena maculata]
VQIGAEPCGFCGRDGCFTQLINKKGGSPTIHSSCPYHYSKMSYKATKQSTKSSPSTNVPIYCPLCPPAVSGDPRTIWIYNAAYHLLSDHSDNGSLLSLSPEFIVQMFIRKQEESQMGIPEHQTDTWRMDNHIPDS